MESECVWSDDTAAVIMAGGRSSRMRRGGCDAHKALRSVHGAPLLAWNIAALCFFGARNIYVAYSVKEPALACWVHTTGRAMAQAAGARLQPILETEPLGTIGAVACLPEEITHAVVVNVDNLTDLSASALLRHHLTSRAAATLAVHEHTFRTPFGRVSLGGGQVRQYQEKPTIPLTISSGTSVWVRRAISYVGRDRTVDLPELIQCLLAAGEMVSAFEHESRWIDVNDEDALREAEALIEAAGRDWPGRDLIRPVHA